VQTLVAYARKRDVPAGRISAWLSRVEQWYGKLWGNGVSAVDAATDRLGLHLWLRTHEPCRWPAWATTGRASVATLHVPLGYQLLVDAPAVRADRRR